MEEKNKLGKTNNKAIVSICVKCNAYNIPHFNYDKGKKHYSIEFQRPVPLDHGILMELKECTDLELFFATYNEKHQMTNWKLAVKTWNENNEVQIPNNLHKPYYRNMFEEIDNYIISTKNNRQGLLDGMQIYCNEEVESEPHFHIKFKDGIDVAVYFDRAEYLEPLARQLTDAELEILVRYLKYKCSKEIRDNFKIDTNWQYLIFAWNNQNYNIKLNDDIVMPGYTKLNERK